MEMMGLCSICQSPRAMYSCSLCGRIVCSNCYDHAARICIDCKVDKI